MLNKKERLVCNRHMLLECTLKQWKYEGDWPLKHFALSHEPTPKEK